MTGIDFDDAYDALAVVLLQEAEKPETVYRSRPSNFRLGNCTLLENRVTGGQCRFVRHR